MDLHTKLRDLRHKKKLSQFDIADSIGVSQSTYSSWEYNVVPKIKFLIKLCKIYEIDISELATLISENDNNSNFGNENSNLSYLKELNEIKTELILSLKREIDLLKTLQNNNSVG